MEEQENPDYLSRQILTYLGNKRSLLDFIGSALEIVQTRLGKEKLRTLDAFSGSGIVSRYLKRFSSLLLVNDLEPYSALSNSCYLANKNELDLPHLESTYRWLLKGVSDEGALNPVQDGLIAELYAPRDDREIRPGERAFFTRRNAVYIDSMRRLIDTLPESERKYFLAPLLSEASIHSNTSGVFKGFYKSKHTGCGKFGGTAGNALSRITGEITLPFPVFSNFECAYRVYCQDANLLVETLANESVELDLAYLDPPYNQHPYGSNYFMLNLILENKRPEKVSRISGIPTDWKRSAYNKKPLALESLATLADRVPAKFVLISFNSEGFITEVEMRAMLEKRGHLSVLEKKYNTFRASRNLSQRNIHVKEYLYLLEK
jgi:adenine-specific DNA-methyltransferase